MEKKECLNKKCTRNIDDDCNWCSMECKKQFLLDNYAENQAILWFKEKNKEFKKSQKKVLAEIKKSGLSIRDYLLSLGEFKDVKI
jgi:uncharacterized protein with GYD domain